MSWSSGFCEVDRLRREFNFLREEMRLKDAREDAEAREHPGLQRRLEPAFRNR